MAKPDLTRYFVDVDDSGSWYLVRADKREAWELWINQDWHNDLSDFQTPSYAMEIDGPHMVTFTDPIEE